MTKPSIQRGGRSALLAGALVIATSMTLSFARQATTDDVDPSPAAPAQRDVDERADAVLRALSETLTEAKQLQFRASSIENVTDEDTGRTVHYLSDRTLTLVRPDRLRVGEGDGFSQHELWFKAGRLTVFDSLADQYTAVDAPETIDAMLDYLASEHGLVLPVADLLFSDPYTVLSAEVQVGAYLGKVTLAGRTCHRLAFRQETIDWQIWIDAEEGIALPRKLVISYKHELGHPQFSVTFTDWDLAPVIADDHFDPSPPPNAEFVGLRELIEAVPERIRSTGA